MGTWIRLLAFQFLVSLACMHAASGQPPWLEDLSLPAVPAEALLEPPPPLEPLSTPPDASAGEPLPLDINPPLADELPPAVFESESKETRLRWYYPWTWIPLDGWTNSAELGINGSEGNSQSLAFQAGARFKRKTKLHLFDVRISHNRTQADGVETQNNALLFADYERFLGESPWTYFVKNGLEYDEFKAFDLRYNINSGLGYSFFRTDDLTLAGRFGAGASREFGGPDNSWTPEALLGGDYEHQLNKRHKLIARVDYFPSWEDFSDFRLVADVGWEQLLNEEGNFSLRLGANDRYDSTPNGRRPNDLNYQALFLYKF
ncbi:MAG: DUF481 domain-containing protein [bacterium]|nr:DUF481 domain-containing protein [bacterium]